MMYVVTSAATRQVTRSASALTELATATAVSTWRRWS